MDVVRSWWRGQWADTSAVVPEYRLIYERGKPVFYLNSVAGLICFRPKTNADLLDFRDEIINRFDTLVRRHKAGECVQRELFRLYADARAGYRGVRMRATIVTRLRSVTHRIVPAMLLALGGCVVSPPPPLELELRVEQLETEVRRVRLVLSDLEADVGLQKSTPCWCQIDYD